MPTYSLSISSLAYYQHRRKERRRPSDMGGDFVRDSGCGRAGQEQGGRHTGCGRRGAHLFCKRRGTMLSPPAVSRFRNICYTSSVMSSVYAWLDRFSSYLSPLRLLQKILCRISTFVCPILSVFSVVISTNFLYGQLINRIPEYTTSILDDFQMADKLSCVDFPDLAS
jgi:hypothetical protein